METVRDFILGGSKITADGDCSHELKRHLLLGRKAMTNLDNILKSRDITLPTKVCLVKAMVFSSRHVWIESWNRECWVPNNWCFWTLVLDKTLESPLDFSPTNPSQRKSVLNIHWNDWCWDWNPNILATWCEELTHWKRPWWWERLKAGREGDSRGWDGWHHRLDGHEFEQASGEDDVQGSLACCSLWGRKELDATEWLNWMIWLKCHVCGLPSPNS